jgi:hypothetical protein
MAFCEAPTTTPEIGISVLYKLPETQALTLVTESVLCVSLVCVCVCVCFFCEIIDEMNFF